eukprot:2512291-Amphidinium_carterae.1
MSFVRLSRRPSARLRVKEAKLELAHDTAAERIASAVDTDALAMRPAVVAASEQGEELPVITIQGLHFPAGGLVSHTSLRGTKYYKAVPAFPPEAATGAALPCRSTTVKVVPLEKGMTMTVKSAFDSLGKDWKSVIGVLEQKPMKIKPGQVATSRHLYGILIDFKTVAAMVKG